MYTRNTLLDEEDPSSAIDRSFIRLTTFFTRSTITLGLAIVTLPFVGTTTVGAGLVVAAWLASRPITNSLRVPLNTETKKLEFGESAKPFRLVAASIANTFVTPAKVCSRAFAKAISPSKSPMEHPTTHKKTTLTEALKKLDRKP